LANLSYSSGPAVPLIEGTIPDVLEATQSRYPDCEALVSRHQKLRVSWRQLKERSVETARGLWAIGIRPGDRVGMWSTSCAEWLYLQIAVARIGAVLVNINPAYRAHDLRHVLLRSRIKVLFMHASDNRADYVAILEEARQGEHIGLERTVLLGSPEWDEMLARGIPNLPGIVTSPYDVVNIQYTSGTTGRPKGVLLTHHNLINNGYLIGRRLKATHEDRICAPVPLYHCFGCVIGVMVALTSGATLVMPAAQFDPLATLEAVHEERCTAIYGVPTMFIAEFEHPRFREFDFSSVRTGVMAGAPCPIDLMKRVVNDMHCSELTICYGQTESSPVLAMSDTGDSLETRVTTVGRALEMTEVKLIDPETGETVPVGRQGELCTRGYLVMKGYDGDPEATARVIDSEGWLHTGDLAIMREDGCYRITGRAKDMISRGGEKIYPREVEEYLHTHPKIADVYVFGIPDARLGEIVGAWISLKNGCRATADEIREYCKGQIAYFKIPQHIRFVNSFPITANGKVQKYLMREFEVRELGLEQIAAAATA